LPKHLIPVASYPHKQPDETGCLLIVYDNENSRMVFIASLLLFTYSRPSLEPLDDVICHMLHLRRFCQQNPVCTNSKRRLGNAKTAEHSNLTESSEYSQVLSHQWTVTLFSALTDLVVQHSRLVKTSLQYLQRCKVIKLCQSAFNLILPSVQIVKKEVIFVKKINAVPQSHDLSLITCLIR